MASKKERPSRPHRVAERTAVANARYFIRNKAYHEAISALLYALEQSTAADVEDAWWRPVMPNGGADGT